MVTTRSHDHEATATTSEGEAAHAGDKRPATEHRDDDDDNDDNASESKGQDKQASGDSAIKKHKSSHERKVVVMPGDAAEEGQQKLGTASDEGNKEDVKEEEATPAPADKHERSKDENKAAEEGDTKPQAESGEGTGKPAKEDEPSSKEGVDAGEGNAEEGQVPKHEPNPDPERKHGILEKGHVYFLYRPKVEVDHPESLDDISKFHILLVPHHTKFHRLIAVGKKALPEASESTRPIWGEVLNVGEDLKALKEGLGSYTYETKTMGTRHQPGARVAGSGAYVLHAAENYPKDSANASAVYHTYLVYELALPHQLGEVQHALHIHEEGGFTLQVKNPEAPSTNPAVRNKPESKQPKYPEELHKLFTTRFIPADPPALLDYPGAELLLIPSKHTPEQDTSHKAKETLDLEEKELESQISQQSNGGEAKKALKEMGLDGLIDGKALEGHWE